MRALQPSPTANAEGIWKVQNSSKVLSSGGSCLCGSQITTDPRVDTCLSTQVAAARRPCWRSTLGGHGPRGHGLSRHRRCAARYGLYTIVPALLAPHLRQPTVLEAGGIHALDVKTSKAAVSPSL